ncbi:hypothetical protein ACRAWF_45855 [Streptomyces sp. L7]
MLAMLVVLAADWAWLTASGHRPSEALFEAARVVAGVGPAAAPPDAHGYQLFAVLAMLSTVVFTAFFTAGVVERMLGPRLIGRSVRAPPGAGTSSWWEWARSACGSASSCAHSGIPVVGVERDPQAATARLARTLGIPVMDGHGGDRHGTGTAASRSRPGAGRRRLRRPGQRGRGSPPTASRRTSVW